MTADRPPHLPPASGSAATPRANGPWPRRCPARVLLLLAAALAAVPAPLAAQGPAPGRATIRAADLRRDVADLASDARRGRLTGTPENHATAELIRSRFERLGLTPPADGGFLQPFDLIQPALGPVGANSLTVHAPGEPADPVRLGRDYYPERFSAPAAARGSVVFVGFGVSAPALGHDDYAAADVAGRVVLVLAHEPGEYDAASPFDGASLSEHARGVLKAREAARRGAVAVLMVTDVHNHGGGEALGSRMGRAWPDRPRRPPRYELGAWVDAAGIPAVRIAPRLAARLLGETGRGFERLAESAEDPSFTPVTTDVEVALAVSVTRRRITQHNVVGLLAGSDPELRDEWVIIGAHLDHEGTVGSRIYAGADDNASGVAGVLAIAAAGARAARDGLRPRRSILLAAWNAEERGLLGSWSYVERPLAPLDRTVAVLNLDMIGRDEEVPARGGGRFRGLPVQSAAANRNAFNVLGYSFSRDLRDAAAAADSLGLTVRFRYDDSRSNLVRRSDHWPFLARGVPGIFIHTGLHPDYHTPGDRPDKLNYDKMARIVRWTYQLAWNLANADGRPLLDRESSP